MFSAITVGKFVATAVVGAGTGKIVKRLIKNNIVPEGLIEKVVITVATGAIVGAITKATKKYTDETIDDVVKTVKTVKDEIAVTAKLGLINKGEAEFESQGLDPNDFELKTMKSGDAKWVRKQKPKSVKSKNLDNLKQMIQDEGLTAVRLKQNDEGEWYIAEKS
jgi:hypothetical protein